MKSPYEQAEEAEMIQKFLNISEKDVPEENREIFNFLKPLMDEFLFDSIPLNINI